MGTAEGSSEAFSTREVPIGRGTLTVRPAEDGDSDGLAELYAGLSTTDRYLRFFCGFRPDAEFLAREAGAADLGGFELVAEHRAHDGVTEIVAAAGWSALPDGDGELAITVARPWRGWLGAFLLDALLEAAAAHGLANLQADVLVQNRSMLALVRRRGFATMGHPDVGVVRVVMGAAERLPTWPTRDERPRVLVEVPGGHWHAEAQAEEAGLRVMTCAGPGGVGGSGCPAVAGSPCPLAAAADVIVVSHPPDDEAWTTLREAHQRLHREVPVHVEPGRRPAPPAAGERTIPSGDDEGVATFVRLVAAHGAEMPQ